MMLEALSIIGALALAGTVASAPQPSDLVDTAVRHAVLDYCVVRLIDPARDDDQLANKVGIELLPPTPGAGPFADAKSMRGIFALHRSSNSKAIVDGIAASGSARGSCLVRIIDWDGGGESLAGFLRGTGSWSVAGEETRGFVHMTTFRKTLADQPYDVGVNISEDTNATPRPHGMRAMISITRMRKAP